jgi:hypothetical protein
MLSAVDAGACAYPAVCIRELGTLGPRRVDVSVPFHSSLVNSNIVNFTFFSIHLTDSLSA